MSEDNNNIIITARLHGCCRLVDKTTRAESLPHELHRHDRSQKRPPASSR